MYLLGRVVVRYLLWGRKMRPLKRFFLKHFIVILLPPQTFLNKWVQCGLYQGNFHPLDPF